MFYSSFIASVYTDNLFLHHLHHQEVQRYPAIYRVSPEIVIAVSLPGAGRRSKVTEDLPLQTNEAYCTVTTGVPMQRNEAYETVLRPSSTTTHSHTSPVYEIVH